MFFIGTILLPLGSSHTPLLSWYEVKGTFMLKRQSNLAWKSLQVMKTFLEQLFGTHPGNQSPC